jgi:hypothetical protein
MDLLLPDQIERNRGAHESGIETGVCGISANKPIDRTSPDWRRSMLELRTASRLQVVTPPRYVRYRTVGPADIGAL